MLHSSSTMKFQRNIGKVREEGGDMQGWRFLGQNKKSPTNYSTMKSKWAWKQKGRGKGHGRVKFWKYNTITTCCLLLADHTKAAGLLYPELPKVSYKYWCSIPQRLNLRVHPFAFPFRSCFQSLWLYHVFFMFVDWLMIDFPPSSFFFLPAPERRKKKIDSEWKFTVT